MTKDQFVRVRDELMKRDRRFYFLYLTGFFAFLIAAYSLSSYIPPTYDAEFTFGFLAILIVNVSVMFLRERNQAQRVRLVCRSCKGGLLNLHGDIAVATGNCPHCGQSAFSSDGPN